MATLAELIVKIGADVGAFDQGIKGINRKVAKFGKDMTNVGKTLTASVTLPVVALGGAIFKMAGDFEAGMNQVKAVTGATGDAFDAMRETAKELGSTTKFSATEAAQGMAFLGQAGFDASEIVGAMPGLLSLAAAGNLELGLAADIASNVLSGFGEAADQAGRAADVLAITAASSNTSVEQLGQALSIVAPVAKGVGLSMEETAALIGKLGDAGIQSEKAGVALRGMISSLLKPSNDAQKALAKLGVEIRNQDGSMRPLIDVVGDLGAAHASATDFVDIFGRRQQAAAAVLAGVGGPALRDFTADIEASEGAAKKMADTMQVGLFGAIKELGSALEGLSIDIADVGLLEFAEKAVDKITGFVRSLKDVNPEIIAMGAAALGATALVGPLALGIGLLVTTLGTVAIPVAATVAAVVGLAAAIGGLAVFASGDAGLSAQFGAMWEKVKELTEGAVGRILGVFSTFQEFIQTAAEWPVLIAVFKGLWATIVEVTTVAFKVIAGVFDGALTALSAAMNLATAVMRGDWENVWLFFLEVLRGFGKGLLALVLVPLKALNGAMQAVADKILDVFGLLEKKTKEVTRSTKAWTASSEDFERALAEQSRTIKTTADETDKLTDGLDDQAKSAVKVKLELFSLSKALKAIEADEKAVAAVAKTAAVALRDDFAEEAADLGRELSTLGGTAATTATQIINLTQQAKLIKPELSGAELETIAFENALDTLGIKSRELKDKELAELAAAVGAVELAMDNGSASAADLEAAQDAYAKAVKGSGGAVEATNAWDGALQQVSTIITDLGKDIVTAFVSGGSMKEKFVGAMDAMKEAVLRLISEEVMGELISALGTLVGFIPGLDSFGKKLGGIFGGGGGGGGDDDGGGLGDVVSGVRGGGVGGGGGGGGSVDMALQSLQLAIMAFDVFGQQVRQINTMGKIEENTRALNFRMGTAGVLGTLFLIKSELMFGTSVKVLEQIRDKTFAFADISLSFLKDSIVNAIGGVQLATETVGGKVDEGTSATEEVTEAVKSPRPIPARARGFVETEEEEAGPRSIPARGRRRRPTPTPARARRGGVPEEEPEAGPRPVPARGRSPIEEAAEKIEKTVEHIPAVVTDGFIAALDNQRPNLQLAALAFKLDSLQGVIANTLRVELLTKMTEGILNNREGQTFIGGRVDLATAAERETKDALGPKLDRIADLLGFTPPPVVNVSVELDGTAIEATVSRRIAARARVA